MTLWQYHDSIDGDAQTRGVVVEGRYGGSNGGEREEGGEMRARKRERRELVNSENRECSSLSASDSARSGAAKVERNTQGFKGYVFPISSDHHRKTNINTIQNKILLAA